MAAKTRSSSTTERKRRGKTSSKKSQVAAQSQSEESKTKLTFGDVLSRGVPRSVYLGLETQAVYDRRKIEEKEKREVERHVKRERFSQVCEKCHALLADACARRYFIDQAAAGMKTENTWQGVSLNFKREKGHNPWNGRGLRYQWPREKSLIYALMAVAVDLWSSVRILPDELRETEFYRLNSVLLGDIINLDLGTEYLAYIEADLAAAGRTNTGDSAEGGHDGSWGVHWDETNIEYIQSGEARSLFTGSKLTASKLSKVVGKIPVHYMQKLGVGLRVHTAEFKVWAERVYPTENERAEYVQEYLANIEARKAHERAKRGDKSQ